jgi:S1-C subfamily serine protease
VSRRVIKVQAEGLTEIPFGDSDRLEVGDFMVAIGNPLQLGQTVTAGIVSGLHQSNVGIGPMRISFRPTRPSIPEIRAAHW